MAIFPTLQTPEDCRQLCNILGREYVTLWATTLPRPTVDVLFSFRAELERRGNKSILLLTSNAIESFCSLSQHVENENTYVFDNIDLLKYCKFIKVLFTYDHCLWRKPKDFFKKIVLFKHNLSTTVLTSTDVCADYVVTINSRTPYFNFKRYPNNLKLTYGKTCTLIPGGYPKLDLLYHRRNMYGDGPFNRVVFFPVSLPFTIGQHGQNLYFDTWHELIEGFFRRFPEMEFVLRPYPPDRNAPVFKALYALFEGQAHFHMDMSDDNSHYLLSSDILITDYSSVYLNFAYATLRPVIWLRPALKEPWKITSEVGVVTCSVPQSLDAIGSMLSSLPQWKERIQNKRDQAVSHAGETLLYLADHLDNILNDSPEADWVVLDKGNTPFDCPADYIIYYVPGRDNAWNCGKNTWEIPLPLEWSMEQHGWNSQIALAALRAYLVCWEHLLLVRRAEIYPQIRLALDMARSEHVLGFLNYRLKKNPDDVVASVALAVLLTNQKGDRSRVRMLLERSASALDPVLAGAAAPIWWEALSEYELARDLLRGIAEYCQYLVPHARLLHALMLACDYDLPGLNGFLELWKQYEVQENWSVEYTFCSALFTMLKEGGEPPFLKEKGRTELLLSDIHMWFRNRTHAVACLNDFGALLLRQAEINPQLWEICSRVQAACGDYKAACVSGWKAARRASVGMDFLVWLTELMRVHGDRESARNILDLLRLGMSSRRRY